VTDKKREMDELRQEMAKLDAQLLGALDKRARLARRLGELRGADVPAMVPSDRGAISALVARSTGDMPAENLRVVFREVLVACMALESPSRITYPGPEGGASHVAARARFGAAAELVSTDSIEAALDEVSRRRADFAVVPLETRAGGPVQATIEALTQGELRIASAVDSTVTLHLMNRTGNAADVEKIYATAADRGACEKLLATFPSRTSVLDVKTPLFACQVALEDHGAAAIAAEELAGPMGLHVAKRSVADEPGERVRYAVVGGRPTGRSGDDVTAFVFNVLDTPGALIDVLRQLSERGVNVIQIQSHPARGEGWSYLFFVEVSGHATDRPLVTAFEDVKRVSRFFKVLGSYPASP